MYDTNKTRRENQLAMSHALALNVSYVVQQSVLSLDPPLNYLLFIFGNTCYCELFLGSSQVLFDLGDPQHHKLHRTNYCV